MVRPDPDWLINLGFSYLHTKVSGDSFFSNPRDFGGGRSDAVIIKDITNAANCAVAPGTAGNAAGSNAFVNFVNSEINAGSTEEHTSELRSLMSISYAVFCLKNK